MLGGRKIDDHSAWVGKSEKGEVFPTGCKTKQYTSAEGEGQLDRYQDKTEDIKAAQEESNKKIRANTPKPMYRH